MSTQTERCFSRKSSGRWGQGIRLNQVNFTSDPPARAAPRGPNLTRSSWGLARAAPPRAPSGSTSRSTRRTRRPGARADGPVRGARLGRHGPARQARRDDRARPLGQHLPRRAASTWTATASVGHDYSTQHADRDRAPGPRTSATRSSRPSSLAARRLIERLDPETTRMGHRELRRQREARRAARQLARAAARGARGDAAARRTRTAPTCTARSRPRSSRSRPRRPSAGRAPAARRSCCSPTACPTAPRAALRRADAPRCTPRATPRGARAHLRATRSGPIAAQRRSQNFEEIVSANGGELLVLDVARRDRRVRALHERGRRSRASSSRTRPAAQPGRAVRLFPDGSFDGFAPLTPGKNELRLTRGLGGRASSVAVTRWVTFEKTPPDPEKLERLRKQLEMRTLETRARRARARQARAERRKKKLEIQPGA